VFSIVGKLIPDQDVETVAQDVFLRAFHSLSKYSYSKPFQHWLTTIAFASCCDFWREEKKRNRNSELDQPSPESIEWIEQAIMNWPLSGEELQAHRNESLEILEYALKQVNPKDRLVIELTLLDDCSMKKAAKKLGWSIINVKVRAMKARRKLRKVISKLLKLKEN
jgi:RNA polymerase sigma-70 factor (ECF subfamily)